MLLLYVCVGWKKKSRNHQRKAREAEIYFLFSEAVFYFVQTAEELSDFCSFVCFCCFKYLNVRNQREKHVTATWNREEKYAEFSVCRCQYQHVSHDTEQNRAYFFSSPPQGVSLHRKLLLLHQNYMPRIRHHFIRSQHTTYFANIFIFLCSLLFVLPKNVHAPCVP